jgi:hypothetical protein
VSPKANPGRISNPNTGWGDVAQKRWESIQTLDYDSLALHLDSVFAIEIWRYRSPVREGNQGQSPEDAL